MKALYEAHATATGGRNGHVSAGGGVLDLDLSIPKGTGWTWKVPCQSGTSLRSQVRCLFRQRSC